MVGINRNAQKIKNRMSLNTSIITIMENISNFLDDNILLREKEKDLL